MVDITGWPTDGAGGSVSTEARWRAMARLWAPSGVVDGYLGGMVPSYAGGNVTVQSGGAWVDGHYCEQLTSNAVAVAATGLVVVRFTPADNRFQLLWVNGATVPTQTTATWELPIAKMTGSVMTDQRAFVSGGSITTGMIGVGAVTTSRIADEAVSAVKMTGGSVSSFIVTGGDTSNTNVGLTGSFQVVVNNLFTKPAPWNTYEIMVWGSAAIQAASSEICSIRASAGANFSLERNIEVGVGLHFDVGIRGRFPALAGATQSCSVDVRRDTAGSATVESAVVSWLAIRTT